MEEQIKQLQEEIEKIKARNRRVEADKAWELSWTRSIFIAGSTFLLLYIFLLLVQPQQAFLNAFFSSLLYLLSTFTYGVLKNWWLKKKHIKYPQ